MGIVWQITSANTINCTSGLMSLSIHVWGSVAVMFWHRALNSGTGTCIAVVWPKNSTNTQLSTCSVQKAIKDLDQKSVAQVINNMPTLLRCHVCSSQFRDMLMTEH